MTCVLLTRLSVGTFVPGLVLHGLTLDQKPKKGHGQYCSNRLADKLTGGIESVYRCWRAKTVGF